MMSKMGKYYGSVYPNYQYDILLNVVFVSKDLFSCQFTCRAPEDNLMQEGIQLIGYGFETKEINKIICIPFFYRSGTLTKRKVLFDPN